MFFHTDNASSSVKMANNVIIIDIIDHFKLKSWLFLLFHLVLQIANPEQNESQLLNEIYCRTLRDSNFELNTLQNKNCHSQSK